MATFVAHLIDHAGRSRYVEYADRIIDRIRVPAQVPPLPLFYAWINDRVVPITEVEFMGRCPMRYGGEPEPCLAGSDVVFVRVDPPLVDDLGLPIFREVAS